MINYLKKYLYYKNHIVRLSKFKNSIPKKKFIKNKKKTYLIIKRDRWRGMFSNVHYAILQKIYAKKKGYTAIIDMKYFPTIYNEENKIMNTYNSWEYYFKNFDNLNIDYVYKFCNYKFSDEKSFDTSKIKKIYYNDYKKILSKIFIKKNIKNKVDQFVKKKFNKKKILGIHIRGSDQKTAALHPYPPTLNQMIKETEKLNDKYNFDLFFLVTEEQNYYENFKKHFGSKVITYDHFRSKDDIFKIYARKNHRYKLGFETIINMMLLSKTNYMLHSNSGFSGMARHFKKNKMKETIIFNGINSKNIIFSNILWYIKFYLPYKFGGFKNMIINK